MMNIINIQQMFLDLNEENVIDVSEIVKGNLIGRGAFGFVFKAVLNKRSAIDGPKSVAMKMLQPVQPGIRTGKVIHIISQTNNDNSGINTKTLALFKFRAH